ncbi:LysR family transcriptional regulator [Rhizobium acidisoli]|uniref:LysR family transcriptional regulator n=1 Tax=Rhizobium acidisoli TaxID=1538158 RepID=A0AAE5TWW3_9HYPH|nr:LysR family transcriptional regulator [Rhizobium acidisoli]KPH08974.1 hypothetical protein AOG23_10735 [Rhizobium acidisoli]QAS78907.1 LysR family transcriptional regulator [Rhizobium acidisoli]
MIDEIRTLVAFAEEGSIQRVADRVRLTQPAVSRQVQRLEALLGGALLDRRQKPPQFTALGARAVEKGREILAAFEEMKALAHGAEPQGVFRLGLANGLSDDGVSSIVAEVVDGFGGISLHLKTGWSGELAELYRQGQLDAAIVLGEAPPGGGAVIGHEELAVIAASQFADRWRAGDFTLADMPWVLSPEPCDARRLLASRVGRRHLPVTGELDDPRLQLAWVRRGAGASLLPRRLLHAVGEGIEEIEAASLALTLPVVLLASPHLGARGVVADTLAARLADVFDRAFEAPDSRPGRNSPKRSRPKTVL